MARPRRVTDPRTDTTETDKLLKHHNFLDVEPDRGVRRPLDPSDAASLGIHLPPIRDE